MRLKNGVIDPKALISSVGRLPLRSVQVIDMNARVQDSVKILNQFNIGVLPLVDERGALQGIVSERDVVRAMQGEDKDSLMEKPVIEISTRDVQVIRTTDTIAYGIQLMGYGGFRHLPVVSRNSYGLEIPVSMLSVTDIMRFFVDEFNTAVDATTGPLGHLTGR